MSRAAWAAGSIALFAGVAGAVALQSGGRQSPGIRVVPGATRPTAAATAVAPPAGVTVAAPTTDVIRTPVATLMLPWAMVFLPDGRLLVTEKRGGLRIVTTAGVVSERLPGSPVTANGGQGGLLDVALDPGYADNHRIWLSFSEPREYGKRALTVMRATLVLEGDSGRLEDGEVMWRQQPAFTEDRHFGGRMAFSPDGKLFFTSSDRHQGNPAQHEDELLGKTIRLNPATGESRIYTIGHRNHYGLVFTPDGRLFQSEMGPAGGDEFNRILSGRNYGWPLVSEGNKGNGKDFPPHSSDPKFTGPLVAWSPTIAPSGMIQYHGTRFRGWDGSFVLGALKGMAIVRVRVDGATAREVGRIPMGVRIREVEEGPDGAIWVLEDGGGGRLLRLDPAV